MSAGGAPATVAFLIFAAGGRATSLAHSVRVLLSSPIYLISRYDPPRSAGAQNATRNSLLYPEDGIVASVSLVVSQIMIEARFLNLTRI